ncbi:glycosyltransferase family 2 protein [Candidatus Woesearchaeota archaeon]|nr:glycosyltransferase family 2 protein [Candidatus Woesearchaeota archaeon]
MNLSIVIPAYNEEKRIKNTLESVIYFLKNSEKINSYEIIIVDDGSNDNTFSSIQKNKYITVLKNSVNKGKGYSIKKGVLRAKCDFILFMDSDLATPMKELDTLYQSILDGYDFVVASRNLKGSNIVVKQSKYRQFAGQFFPFFVNIIVGLKFKDTQCGFKLMKAEPAKKIFSIMTIDRFAFDVEMLYLAKNYGYKVAEVPVTWVDQKGSTVHFLKDSWRMLHDLFKIRVNTILGKYK